MIYAIEWNNGQCWEDNQNGIEENCYSSLEDAEKACQILNNHIFSPSTMEEYKELGDIGMSYEEYVEYEKEGYNNYDSLYTFTVKPLNLIQ